MAVKIEKVEVTRVLFYEDESVCFVPSGYEGKMIRVHESAYEELDASLIPTAEVKLLLSQIEELNNRK